MTIKIDKGFPVPKNQKGDLANALRQMKVGDSFVLQYSPASVYGAAASIGIKVSMRLMPDGLRRVWRVK